MLEQPKGYEYLLTTPNGLEIAKDAPDWAVESLTEYIDMLTPKTDKDGNIKYY